ncbi:T9SS type A sorting domain-containing protein [Dyadobacter sp. CY312]|uniref:T9SS type A sorting domain-containing protein n=1 Tax=Dyadobacter sp. CY312 TaxID=2907303 RepID=UPI001F2F7B19|nr:T9SS type A sorting domain-containing protein [Dyadobacter sp. CY312]MCE7043414.1 T9SS type A sorting domain-containing protein [Dyadobacter sp. CY312]
MKVPSRNRSDNGLTCSLKLCLLFLLVLIQSGEAWAQLRIVPNESRNFQNEQILHKSAARTAAALDLPFFDDFSTAKGTRPDTAYWMSGSGVFINNTLTNNHPSINIATFDGLNASGRPYNSTSPLREDYNDTLTSQPINLSTRAAKDSIYISFYWLGRGLGERPDSSDFMSLEFLDVQGNWEETWKQQGDIIDTAFQQKFVKITEQKYFHDKFQFRFRSFGRNSGMYDMWHLDYVYLNAKRTSKDQFMADITVRNPLTSFLKGYSAMPLAHYRLDAAKYTAASVATDVINRNEGPNKFTYTFSVKDERSKTVFADSNYPGDDIKGSQQQRVNIPIAPLPADTSKRISLRYKFQLLATDDQNPIGDLSRNDSVSAVTNLDDYYAYDDGSAEYGVQITQKLARAAVKFTIAKSDYIGGVRLALVPFGTDVTGQGFVVQLYDDNNGVPGALLKQQAIAVKYPDSRNGFLDCKFEEGVLVPETFYVGWLQLNELPVSIGLDRNSTTNGRIFSSLSTTWATADELKGNIMIRPYLGVKGPKVTGGLEPADDWGMVLFPNPGNGVINWKSNNLKKIDVYSVEGRLMRTVVPQSGQRSETLNVPNGMYILKSTDGRRSFTQKVVIVK